MYVQKAKGKKALHTKWEQDDDAETDVFDHYPSSPTNTPREWPVPERRSKRKPKNRRFSRLEGVYTDSNSDALVAREWIIPGLREWSFDATIYSSTFIFSEPSVSSRTRSLPPSLRIGRQSPYSDASSWHARLDGRSARSSWSWETRLGRYTDSEPSAPHRETEEYLRRLPAAKVERFYNSERLERNLKLTGPENYFPWAEEMQSKLVQCQAWSLVENDLPPVPVDSSLHTRWKQLNDKAWLLLISNVSREIRRDLCASWCWDTRGTWCYLRQTYGGSAAIMMRSVQGVLDMNSLRYEDCASLGEFLGKMKECIQAIECNRGEKEIDEGLWCRFILAKLGPRWESWTAGHMRKVQASDGTTASLGRLDQLLLDVEAEEARRVRASRYRAPKID